MRLRSCAVVLSCLAIAGCGGTNSNPEDPSGESAGSATSDALVPAQDVARVRSASQAITAACRDATARDVETLVDVYESAGAEAIFEPGNAARGQSMTSVLEENRDQLLECGQDDLAARLDQALGEGEA